jgi:hypothetical protein
MLAQIDLTNRRSLIPLAAGCLLLALCALCGAGLAAYRLYGARGPAAGQPSVEYVLDASPRMTLPSLTGGARRLAVAQSVLDEIIRPSDPALTTGLRVFGTGKLAESCADTDLLVPLAAANQAKISASLLAVSPGPQPDAALGAAVVAALRDLALTPGPHALVVVTGGSDSCNEQAGELIAAEAKRSGIDYQLFVIGFQVPDDQDSAVSGLVDGGNGHYIHVSTVEQLRAVLQAIQQYVANQKSITVAGVLATAAAVLAEPTAIPATQTPPAHSVNPTATPTLAPTNTPGPTPNLAPRVIGFLARFDPVRSATLYSVTVSVATSTVTGTAPVFSYAWSNSNPCGQFTGTTSPVAEWRHPDVPGSCPNEPVHPGVITVVVSDAYGAVKCVYNGGSAPGNMAQCQDVPK